MAYYIVAAGGTLYQMTTAGSWTALTLPSDVTLSSTRRSRMAVLGRHIVVVNGPTRNIQVDPYGVVRHAQLQPPQTAATAAASSGSGNLTGAYKTKYTFLIKDRVSGELLAESDMSPESAEVTLTAKKLALTNVSTSSDLDVTHRRIYRTTAGGTTYFHWLDLEGNETTALEDDITDAALSLLAEPTELGLPPGGTIGTYMTMIASWKNHLWGVGDIDIETLRYSGNGSRWGWPATYGLTVPAVGADQFGITGFLPRRDEFGVGRRNSLHKVIHGGTNTDGSPNFELLEEFKGVGPWSPDANITVNDIAYFLGEDGFYSWGPGGIQCVSDQAGVRKWFTSTSYFNRALFSTAFVKYNRKYNGIELHLAAAGSSNIDRWVYYDISNNRFYGPHKTDAFTPTIGFELIDSNVQGVPAMGTSGGFIAIGNSSSFTDWTTAIAMDIKTRRYDADTPTIQKLFGGLTVYNSIQSSAGNFRVTFYLGRQDSVATSYRLLDQRDQPSLTSPIGNGDTLQLQFTESTNSLGCELLGFELDTFETGKRIQ